MWKSVLTLYVGGLIFTGVALLSARETRHDLLMNVVSIVLWPAYWAYFLLMVLLNRNRS